VKRLLLVCLAGCASAPARPPSLEPLGDTVALTEVTSSGDHVPLASDGVSEVDINSRIEVHVDRAKVQDLFERQQGGDATETQRVRAKLKQLDDLTRQQQQMVKQLVDLKGAWLAEGSTSVPTESLQRAVRQFNQALSPLNASIKRYAVAAGQSTDTYFAQPGFDGVYKALDDERQKVLAQAAALANSSGLRWRMQAELTQGKPIHLQNYDNYPDGTFTVVDKLAPQASLKEISAQLDEAKQLAKDVKDLSGLKDALVKSAVTALQGVLSSLQDTLHGDLATLEPVVKAIPDAALSIKEVAAVKKQLDDLVPTLQAIQTGCAPILDAIKKGSLAGVTVAQGEACLHAVQPHGSELLAQAKAAGLGALALIDLVKKDPSKFTGVLQPVQDLVPKLATVAALQPWADTIGKGWTELKSFLQLSSDAAAATQWTSDQQTDHLFAEITDTAIDLRRTDRKEGDFLYFRPSIVKQDGSAAVVGATSDMRVVRMGAYIDVSAGVGFVDRKDNHWGPFSAAPGVVAAVHYHSRPLTTAARLFNAVQPGLGVHFLYPDLGSKQVNAMGVATGDDPSFELGVGGTVTLFGDLIQVGAGYDLQVNASYWYIGFGLDTLAKLGVRFSPGS
jgi:hypothetical protein